MRGGRSALKDLEQRVMAMAMIQEKLYQSRNLAQINFGEFLEDLIAYLGDAAGGSRDAALRVKAEKVFIPVNIAIPGGLIVNELVTNALKYAFSSSPPAERFEKKDEIQVTFETHADDYALTVSDNGVGLPPELDWRTTESLGLKLVNLWVSYQLRACFLKTAEVFCETFLSEFAPVMNLTYS